MFLLTLNIEWGQIDPIDNRTVNYRVTVDFSFFSCGTDQISLKRVSRKKAHGFLYSQIGFRPYSYVD